MKKYFLSLLLALGILLISATAALAATFYVSPSGNDANSGSSSSPVRTIARALTLLSPGDTLILRDGVYVEVISKIPSGTPGNPVTIRSENPGGAIIRPPRGSYAALVMGSHGNRRNSAGLVNSADKFITIDGLVLDGSGTTGPCLRIAGTPDQNVSSWQEGQPSDIRIINNEIMNCGGAQTSTVYQHYASPISSSRANNIYFAYNHIHNAGVTDYDHGIYHFGRNGIIEFNEIHHIAGTGIKIGWNGVTENIIVRNNYIYDNNQATGIRGVKKQGAGISTHFSRGVQICNNIISGPHLAGVSVGYSVTNATVCNNTITVTGSNYSAMGIQVGRGAGCNIDVFNTRVINNIIYMQNTPPTPPSMVNAAIAVGCRATGTVLQGNVTFGTNPRIEIHRNVTSVSSNNNIVADPLFISLAARDFRLSSGSPATGRGADVPTVMAGIAQRGSSPGTGPGTGPGSGTTKTSTGFEGFCALGFLDTAVGCIPFEDTNLLVAFVLRLGTGIGGGVAFVLMLYSGFQVMTSAGDPKRLQAGKELLTASISGLLLLVFSVFILRVIGVDILGIF